MPGVGFGAGRWGSSAWGGAAALLVEGAVAARENAIQVEFSQKIYFSGVLDPKDASDVSNYTLTPVAGGVAMDGSPVRPVNIVAAALVDVTGGAGRFLELTLDRPMSPWPCQYSLGLNGIWLEDQSNAMPDTEVVVAAVFKQLVKPSLDVGIIARDIANPQTLSNAYSAQVPDPLNPNNLGTIVVDDTGDYASDDGNSAYKMRILRRAVTIPGGFVHLGDEYGVGIPSHGKRLAQAGVLGRLSSELEKQVGKEPETEKVVVRTGFNSPGSVRFVILAKPKVGQALKFAMPFAAK